MNIRKLKQIKIQFFAKIFTKLNVFKIYINIFYWEIKVKL